jgi:hypothetical protein
MTNNEFYNLLKNGTSEEEILKTLQDQINAAKAALAAEAEKTDKLNKARSALAAALKDYCLALGGLEVEDKDLDAILSFFDQLLKIYEGELNEAVLKVGGNPSLKTNMANPKGDKITSALDDDMSKNISKLISFVDRLGL